MTEPCVTEMLPEALRGEMQVRPWRVARLSRQRREIGPLPGDSTTKITQMAGVRRHTLQGDRGCLRSALGL